MVILIQNESWKTLLYFKNMVPWFLFRGLLLRIQAKMVAQYQFCWEQLNIVY